MISIDPDRGVRIERLTTVFGVDDTLRRTDDVRRTAGCRGEEYFEFDLMESVDAIAFCNRRPGHPPIPLDLSVGIEERKTKRFRQGAPKGGLTCTHWADEDDVRRGGSVVHAGNTVPPGPLEQPFDRRHAKLRGVDTSVLETHPALVLAASLALVAVAAMVSRWLGLGFEKSILWASIRAAVQLITVGVLLTLIVGSDWEKLLAPIWIVAMVAIAAQTVVKRSGQRSLWVPASLAVGASVGLSLVVVFGLGVLPAEPIQMIVIAGITIGNCLSATVVAADQVRKYLTDDRAVVEGLLALGIEATRASRYIVAEATRVALLPQIERTKVVGLVALPGAFTGLLIAGVAPFEAAIIQLVVMYLVLGSVAVSSSVVAVASVRSAFTPDQRLRR